MNTSARGDRTYALGHDPEELSRLERQAKTIEGPTRMILQAAGLASGMRALDLGTGLGHVARLMTRLVGPSGSVVGIDTSEDVLRAARRRTEEEHESNVSFVSGDATTWRTAEPFDAIVERLLLFHVADPVAVVRHHVGNLKAGGVFVAMDFDMGAARAEPAVAPVNDLIQWVTQAFRAAGAAPTIGSRLGVTLERAGLQGVTTFGVQPYLAPHNPAGPAMLAGVVRSLAPAMLTFSIATAEQLQLETLEQRIADALRAADAVLLPPALAGAWGHAG